MNKNGTNKECKKIFIITFGFRILIILMSLLIFLLFINQENSFNINSFIENWIKWDSIHYIRISNGYKFYIENGLYPTLAFFPLYPFFISIFSFIFSKALSGLIVSNLSISIACIFIYKLVCMDYDKKTAKITLLLLNIFPFSFFFSGIMSESVFLLFSVITLYYIRKHNWFLVGFFGALCSLSRFIGIFLIIPALVEVIEEYQLIKKIKNFRFVINTFLLKIIPILLISFGFFIYLYLNYDTTGDYFYFLKIQKKIWFQSYKHFFLFFDTCFGMIKSFDIKFLLCVPIPQLFFSIFSFIVLILNVKKNKTMYSIWLLINIIINTSISWPLSFCRYISCAIPFFIFIAAYLKKHYYLYITYIIISSMLFVIYFTMYLKGSSIM